MGEKYMSDKYEEKNVPYKDNKYSKSNYLISAKYASSLLENNVV